MEGPREEGGRGLGPWLPEPPPPLPPGYTPPVAPDEPPPFRPVRRRARWAAGILAVSFVADVVAVALGLSERGLLTRLVDGEVVPPDELSASDDRQLGIGLAQAIVLVAAAVAFLAWFFRAYTNLEALGVQRLRYGRRWSVGAWFVPILNLFRPKQIANDIWRGSDPDAAERPLAGIGSVPALFWFWWAAFLLSGALYNAAARAELEAVVPEALLTTNGLWLAADVVGAISAPLAIAVVLRTTSRQERRAARLGLATVPFPTPLLRRGTTWAAAALTLVVVALQVAVFSAILWAQSLPAEGSPLGSPRSGVPPAASSPIAGDSFEDPASGWLVETGADYSMGYIDGEYVITSELEGANHSYVLLEEPAAGVRIEVVGRLAYGRRIDGYGIACWSRDDAGYFASVYADRYYQIVKDPPGPDDAEAEVIASGRAKRSAIGVREGATALELTCRETGSEAASLTLTANGVELARVRDRDPLLYVTGVGLFVASTSGDAGAAFDDLRVEVLD